MASRGVGRSPASACEEGRYEALTFGTLSEAFYMAMDDDPPLAAVAFPRDRTGLDQNVVAGSISHQRGA